MSDCKRNVAILLGGETSCVRLGSLWNTAWWRWRGVHCDNSQGPAEHSRLHLMNLRFAYSLDDCQAWLLWIYQINIKFSKILFFLLDVWCIYLMICFWYFWLIFCKSIWSMLMCLIEVHCPFNKLCSLIYYLMSFISDYNTRFLGFYDDCNFSVYRQYNWTLNKLC